MPNRLNHVSIGYPRRDFVDVLEGSSKWNECRFIFMPRHWGATPFGVINKVTVLKAWLESGEIDLGEVVLFTDAYDTLLVQNSAQILQKFYSFNADLIISAESHFWPTEGREEVKDQFEIYESKWRYLNSGGYIGYAWAIKAMVDYCAERLASGDWDFSKPDDQALTQRFFLANRHGQECRVRLDIEAEIFASLNTSVSDFVVSRSRVLRRSSGVPTCVLHANADKGNLDILHRYWALVGGPTQKLRDYDLRLVGAEGKYLSYDVDAKRLRLRDALDGMTLVLFVKGERQAIAFIPALGIATFTMGHAVHHDAVKVAAWEILNLRPDILTEHGLGILDYVVPDNRDMEVSLCDIPLVFLLHPCFDDLLIMVSQHEHSI